ncbi:MAG TPA: NAD(P)H-hydrate dehydratase [Acidimicrobiia bacterium]|nr:NAD(P)H-hydrate dehydratase [Acidimicrobiia bacterium]
MDVVLTPEQMGAADRRTIAAGTPVEVLMDRAGRAVAWTVRRALPGAYGRRVAVVCGKGNNGGDGLVAARVLASWGVRTTVFELAAGIDRRRCARAFAAADVVVDAMYGTGFRGTLDGDAAWVVEQLEAFDGEVVAVDIPSGVDGLTGTFWGPTVRATRTVTFAARKPGLVFEPGRSRAGQIVVADIGIAPAEGIEHPIGLVDAADVGAWLPSRAPDAHKWTSGVLVVGGSGGMTGAPLLVSHAAMRAGAGIVWCALPGDDAAHRASGGEVITKALPADEPAGTLARGALETLLADVGRFAALAVGPGLGGAGEPDLQFVVRGLVAEARPPLVLDADGLNALAGDFTSLRARRTLGAATVLTPHAGEYERLMGAPVGGDRLGAARALADRSGAVVLLKGPGTVVAGPDGAVVLNPTGGAELATAGSGDALSGIIAGFLARGADAFRAAAAGAWVHGRIADRLVETDGPGVIASDLVAGIGRTLQELGVKP